MDYFEIYLAIASVSNIVVSGLLFVCLFYLLSVLHDIKRLSSLAKKEAEIIAKGFEKGAAIFGSEISGEASAFVRTIFAMLLSYFAKPKRARKNKN